jgi:hypothetical protein
VLILKEKKEDMPKGKHNMMQRQSQPPSLEKEEAPESLRNWQSSELQCHEALNPQVTIKERWSLTPPDHPAPQPPQMQRAETPPPAATPAQLPPPPPLLVCPWRQSLPAGTTAQATTSSATSTTHQVEDQNQYLQLDEEVPTTSPWESQELPQMVSVIQSDQQQEMTLYRWPMSPYQAFRSRQARPVEDLHTASILASVLANNQLTLALKRLTKEMNGHRARMENLDKAIKRQRPLVVKAIADSEGHSDLITAPVLREGQVVHEQHDYLLPVQNQVDLLNMLIAQKNSAKVEMTRAIHTVTEIKGVMLSRPRFQALTRPQTPMSL